MDWLAEFRAAKSEPQKLEHLYQVAQQENQVENFQSALGVCYEETPENLLYAAWFYRLQQRTETPSKPRREVNWALAIPLSVLTGLIFWVLSDFDNLVLLDRLPHLTLW